MTNRPLPPPPQTATPSSLTPPQRSTPPTQQMPASQAPVAGYGAPPTQPSAAYPAPNAYGAYAPQGYGAPPVPTQAASYGAPPPPTGYGAPPAPTHASGYGAPPAPTGYGPPPAGQATSYAAPLPAPIPANAYGAPPQSTYGSLPPLGWQQTHASYGSVPPPGATPKKPGVPPTTVALIAGGALFGVLALTGLGVGAYALLHTSHKPLPIEAVKLPADTDFLQQDRFPGADGPPAVRDAYLAADLARHVCGAGSDFTDRVTRLRTVPAEAPSLFDPRTLEARRATLECGQSLVAALESPNFTEIVFHDGDDKKFLSVQMLRLKLSELPTKYGFARQTFAGMPGFCLVSPKKTEPDVKWTTGGAGLAKADEKDGECTDHSLSAFADKESWFFGRRAAVEAFARSYAKPRKEISTTVENLQLAFDSGEGLAVRRTDARPKGASSLLRLPCSHAAFDSGAGTKFLEECLPKSVEKNVSAIDAKVRAVTYEMAAPIQDADGIRFNLVFVARDDSAARDVEGELKDATRDWKSSVENSQSKLAKLVREAPSGLGQKKWNVAVDPFVRAVQGATVKRDGRVVRVQLATKFTDSEQKEMREALGKTTEDQEAAAAITQALIKRQPVPEASLAQIVGSDWAAFALAPRATEKECAAVRERLTKVDPSGFSPAIAPSMRFALKFRCEGTPLPSASVACLTEAKDATAFGRCSIPTNPLDKSATGTTVLSLPPSAKTILQ